MFQYQVSFDEAIRRAFQKYCCFTGRASRSEYWWFALFNVILGVIIGIIGIVAGQDVEKFLQYIVQIALFLPGLGLCFRRLHDTGRSAWNLFWWILPIVGWIILIVYFCQESQPQDNKYGPIPNLAE